jgi:hypothetical protein
MNEACLRGSISAALSPQQFSKLARALNRIFASCPQSESFTGDPMATSRERNRFTGFAAALTSTVAALARALICTLVWADTAAASQDPGVAAGTASSLTQAMMAMLVYGASALVVGSGLIGALRQQ